MAKLIVASYRRVWPDTGLDRGEPVPLIGWVAQDSGHGCDSEIVVVWHESTMADMARLDFDAEEYVGAIEAIEARFQESEERACARESARQRTEAA